MAINLNKHRELLVAAWKDVLDDKTATDWALFGYEGQTNDLKVVNTGSGGIEELTDDLNSGKIMYAFVKVNDPKTSLPKCVLINWQGEGANTVRKGICANHLRDVEGLFLGANLTINARTEDEVDTQLVIDKVSKTGSAYSFKAPRSSDNLPDKTAPIGTNYQRVNPIQEINARDRDQFWLKEEQEEKRRVEEERRRRDEERAKLEQEARQREAEQAAQREQRTNERNTGIDQIKHAEQMAQHQHPSTPSTDSSTTTTNNNNNNNNNIGAPTMNHSDLVARERTAEAQQLIAQRGAALGDARAIFERNTSAGQLSTQAHSTGISVAGRKITPEKPVRQSLVKKMVDGQERKEEAVISKGEGEQRPSESNGPSNMAVNIPNKLPDDTQSDEDSDQFATIKRSPKDATTEKKNSVSSPTVEEAETSKNTIANTVKQDNIITKVEKMTDQQFVDEVIYGDLTNPGIQAKALYDYQAADETEITFDPGEIITNIEMVDDGWWQGFGPDGTYGLFPANYVELIK